jgi:prepilin-type N-terminal cleavage/methylation domain-containing protein
MRIIASRPKNAEKGFTLLELLVVILILGILAAIAMPQYFKVVEKGKAAEAFSTLDHVRSAEERFLATTGNYCLGATSACTGFDLQIPVLKYFSQPAIVAGTGSPSWKATVTRNTNVGMYGNYVISIDVEPGASPSFSCNQSNCSSDLMPQ